MADVFSNQKNQKNAPKGVLFNQYSTMKYSALQNALIYQDADIKRQSPVVGEEKAPHIDALFAATKRYMNQMRELDRRCMGQTTYLESIYNEVASVNDTMLQECARFEKEVKDKFIIK